MAQCVTAVGMVVAAQHTSCSLTINENYDKDVREDMEDALNRVAPEVRGHVVRRPWCWPVSRRSYVLLLLQDVGYRHDMEGPDDMPAHIKATLVGSSLSIPSEYRAVRVALGLNCATGRLTCLVRVAVTHGKLALGTWQVHTRARVCGHLYTLHLTMSTPTLGRASTCVSTATTSRRVSLSSQCRGRRWQLRAMRVARVLVLVLVLAGHDGSVRSYCCRRWGLMS